MEPTATRFRNWWNAKSVFYSRIGGGDTFTHGEVVVYHIILLVLIILAGSAGGFQS